MTYNMTYKGITIERNIHGMYYARPGTGRCVQADTLAGVRGLIRKELAGIIVNQPKQDGLK